MPLGYLDCSPDLFVEFLRFCREDQRPKRFKILKDGLPEDAKLIATVHVPLSGRQGGAIRLWIESAQYTPNQEILAPTILTIYEE